MQQPSRRLTSYGIAIILASLAPPLTAHASLFQDTAFDKLMRDTTSAFINYYMSLNQQSSGPAALGTSLAALATGVGAPASELAACQAEVAAGKSESIGLPEDPHHSICYRLALSARLSAAIEANGTTFQAMAADFLQKSTPPGGF